MYGYYRRKLSQPRPRTETSVAIFGKKAATLETFKKPLFIEAFFFEREHSPTTTRAISDDLIFRFAVAITCRESVLTLSTFQLRNHIFNITLNLDNQLFLIFFKVLVDFFRF